MCPLPRKKWTMASPCPCSTTAPKAIYLRAHAWEFDIDWSPDCEMFSLYLPISHTHTYRQTQSQTYRHRHRHTRTHTLGPHRTMISHVCVDHAVESSYTPAVRFIFTIHACVYRTSVCLSVCTRYNTIHLHYSCWICVRHAAAVIVSLLRQRYYVVHDCVQDITTRQSYFDLMWKK